MIRINALAAPAAILFALAGCASGSAGVQTVTAPEANLFALRTFNLLPNATGPSAQKMNEPMLVTSALSRTMRTDLVKGFEDRGYVHSQSPDFLVAYYAAGKDELDVRNWDYGYPFHPRWWGPGSDWGTETEMVYPKGTVLIDVVDARTREVIWRGKGVANFSSNEQQNEQELGKTLTAILQKFPTASNAKTPAAAAGR